MASWSLGSAADEIQVMLGDNIPSAISGTRLVALVDRNRLRMETFTGITIGSVGIAEKYQYCLFAMSLSDTLQAIQAQGAAVGDIQLGDLSYGKGNSNVTVSSAYWQSEAQKALADLGRRVSFMRVIS